MSTVDKLSIRGVRSFGPDHEAVIDFPKPLTLIVGRNGSGKTARPRPLAAGCGAASLLQRARGLACHGAWQLSRALGADDY